MDRNRAVMQERIALQERAARLPKGWVMMVGPSADDLPRSLSHREVDAIAMAPDGGGIVFEVVTRGSSLESSRKLQEIDSLREDVQKSAGWDLEVLVLPDPGVEVEPGDIAKRLTSAVEMARYGVEPDNEYFVSSGFTLAFSALELTLAKWCQELDLKYSPNASAMATLLVSEGYMSDVTFRDIRQGQNLRNHLAHGREAPSVVTLDSVLALEALVRRVDSELKAASRERTLDA